MIALSVSNSNQIGSHIFQKRGNQTLTRHVDISRISNALGEFVSAALPGLHTFTDCDIVSLSLVKVKFLH